MDIEEFSSGFDTLCSSYMRSKNLDPQESLDSIEFDEFEKSQFLTYAQDEIFTSLYSGDVLEGFEGTERVRKSLDSLIKYKNIPVEEFTEAQYVPKSGLYCYPIDFSLIKETKRLLYITYESAKFNDDSLDCGNGATVLVVPIRHDELAKTVQNPFRGANTSRVLRVDVGYHKVELLSSHKLEFYYLGFLEKPTPIILASLEGQTIDGYSEPMTSVLDSSLHRVILEKAVQKALASKARKSN